MKSSISLASPHSRIALVEVHHHGPLEVRHGAGYRVYAVVVRQRTAVFGEVSLTVAASAAG